MPDQNSSPDIPSGSQTDAVLDPLTGDIVSQTRFSAIDFPSDRDWFGVALGAGVAYWFRIDAASYLWPEIIAQGEGVSGPSVQVFNPATGYVSASTSLEGTDFAVMQFTPQTAGTYFVEASGGFGQTGEYGISYGRTASVGPLQLIFDNLSSSPNGLSPDATISLGFNAPAYKGQGTAILYEKVGASRVFVADFNFNAPSATALQINGGEISIDPASPLKEGTDYQLVLGAGFLRNVLGQASAPIELGFRTGSGSQGEPPPTVQVSFVGNDGNNAWTSNSANNSFNGLGGIDTVGFAGSRAQYALSKVGSFWFVDDGVSSRDGSDQLDGIERLQFTDRAIALDLAPGQSAGNTMLLLSVLGPTFMQSPDIVGGVIRLFDEGRSLLDMFQLAIDVNLVSALAGGNTMSDYARLAVSNVLRTPEPDPAIVDFLVGLTDGRYASWSPADVFQAVSLLEVNSVQIGLPALQQTGLEFA